MSIESYEDAPIKQKCRLQLVTAVKNSGVIPKHVFTLAGKKQYDAKLFKTKFGEDCVVESAERRNSVLAKQRNSKYIDGGVFAGDVHDYTPSGNYDLVWLDFETTDLEKSYKLLQRFLECMQPNGIIAMTFTKPAQPKEFPRMSSLTQVYYKEYTSMCFYIWKKK